VTSLSAGEATTTQGRRKLQFKSLDHVVLEVERLLQGHATIGNSSLAQIRHHLSTVMCRVVDLPASMPVDPSQ
jgi:hypothetical protein